VREVTIGRSQAALTQFRYPMIFIEGPRGTSKSRGILTVLLRRLLKYPGARLGIGRQFRADLTKTILTTLEEEVFPAFGMKVPGSAHRENRSEYQLDNGSAIYLFGIDQGKGALSMGLTFLYLAEVTEPGMELETITDMAGAMRWMQSPENPQLPDYTQIAMDGNPVGPGHPINKMCEDVAPDLRIVRTREDYERIQAHNYAPAADPVHRPKRIITTHKDNPGYWDHDAWDYTPLGRNYVTQQLEGLTGFKRKRWLDGLWAAAEGAVYPEFDEQTHVIDPFPNGIPRDWPVYVAKDPGRDHPDATLFCAVAPNGRLYFCAESVVRQTTVEQDARVLTQMCANYKVVRKLGDPHYMFSVTKMSDTGRTIAQQMREFGHVFEPAPAARNQTEIAQQVDMVRTLLVSKGADGYPMLQVFRSCPKVINGFQSWGYQRDGKGRLKGGEDKFEDVADDEMDCVRMLVASRPRFEPQAIRSLSKPAVDDGPVVLPNGRKRWYGDED
jgi:hypothetical protein